MLNRAGTFSIGDWVDPVTDGKSVYRALFNLHTRLAVAERNLLSPIRFSLPGSYLWKSPISGNIIVTCIGGGGAGGCNSVPESANPLSTSYLYPAISQRGSGSGGGAGQVLRAVVPVAAGTYYRITLGRAGTTNVVPVSGLNPGNGLLSAFSSADGLVNYVLANGGTSGSPYYNGIQWLNGGATPSSVAGVGGSGGTVAGGASIIAFDDGTPGNSVGGNGFVVTGASYQYPGAGGSCYMGLPGIPLPGVSLPSVRDGIPAQSYGAGGAGCYSQYNISFPTGMTLAGGDGAPGLVMIEFGA